MRAANMKRNLKTSAGVRKTAVNIHEVTIYYNIPHSKIGRSVKRM